MKKFIVCIIVGLFGSVFVTNASLIHHGAIDVTVNSFVQKGDLVVVDMNIVAAPKSIESHRTLTLTPVLVTENNRYELPVVILNGHNRQRSLDRAIALDKVETNGQIFEVLEVSRKTPTIVNYQITIPFDSWMKSSALIIEEDLCNCGGARGEYAKNMLAETLMLDFIPHQITPTVTFIIPDVETVKNRNATGQAFLNYKDGQSKILPDFRTNKEELNKIDALVMQTKNDKNVSVQGITIKGYASPEGPFALNERLSKERATAMKLYMQTKYGFSNNSINVLWYGEDWNGLKELVEKSDLTAKTDVLAIINSNKSPDQKDQDLKTLNKGTTYRILFDQYYPKLRRSDYQVDYMVKGFTVEEGITIIEVHPEQLSLNELYAVANSYPEGSDEYNRIFNIAVEQYPNDPVANINVAAIALKKKDKAKAHRHLDRFKTHADAWNNLGVLYLLEGDTDTAANYFDKASRNGNADAIFNMEQLKLYKENIQNGVVE